MKTQDIQEQEIGKEKIKRKPLEWYKHILRINKNRICNSKQEEKKIKKRSRKELIEQEAEIGKNKGKPVKAMKILPGNRSK